MVTDCTENELACGWLSEYRRYSERPGLHAPAWFRSDLDSVLIANRNPLDSVLNPNRITLVNLNSNQSKARLLAAKLYVPCPVYGLLCVYVACWCPQVRIHNTHTTWAFSEKCINVCHRWTYGTSGAYTDRNNYCFVMMV